MAKDAADAWRDYFQNWPHDVERRGVLLTSFGEQIPFEEFALSDDLLLVERRSPDTLGARMVLVAFPHIQGVKIVDVVKLRAFQTAGFKLPPGRK
jgi:hypothetical protein